MKLPVLFAQILLIVVYEACADDAAKELEKLQGSWLIASAQEGGEEQVDERSKKMTLVIKDDSLIFRYEGQPKSLVMKLKLDPSSSPKSVDLTSTLREGQITKGIYERKGDELKLCWSRNGKARPGEFSTKSGDDRMFFTLKLIKDSRKDK